MKHIFLTIILLLVYSSVWGNSEADISAARKAVEIYADIEFKGGDPHARREVIKFSPERIKELKEDWPGIMIYLEFSEHQPQYVVNEYKIKDVRIEGIHATASISFQRLARTEDTYGSGYIAESPHQETVSYSLIFDRNKWYVLDPPPPRISKQFLIEYYEYQVKEYSAMWEKKLNDPTYDEEQKANVRSNRDQATGTLRILKSLP